MADYFDELAVGILTINQVIVIWAFLFIHYCYVWCFKVHALFSFSAV